jgi:hypothetical protein
MEYFARLGKPKSALVMAVRSSDSALGHRLISQYERPKHLCDRLSYTLDERAET